MTSHDVVAIVRKRLSTRKVGHAGTLDPLATGVLVVCVGKATRLSNYLTGQSKRYRTRIHLGVQTDTLDSDGTVVSTNENIPESIELIESEIDRFRGCISQTPPMFSALKVNGKRLHKLAREGKTIVREAREVEIHELRIIAYQAPFLDLEVSCSKGTYVRSLAADIGSVLGCGGSVTSLRRLQSGSIHEDACLALDEVVDQAAVLGHLVDPNEALVDIPGITLDEVQIAMFEHGNTVTGLQGLHTPCRVLDSDGALWGMGQEDLTGGLRPLCVLKETETLETHSA
jgi:tRNA pseudouridine55 synthase